MRRRSLTADIIEGKFTPSDWMKFNSDQRDVIYHSLNHFDVTYDESKQHKNAFESIMDCVDSDLAVCSIKVKKRGNGAAANDSSGHNELMSRLKAFSDEDLTAHDVTQQAEVANEQKLKNDKFICDICLYINQIVLDDIFQSFFMEKLNREEIVMKMQELSRLLSVKFGDDQVAHAYHTQREAMIRDFNTRLRAEIQRRQNEINLLSGQIQDLRRQRQELFNNAVNTIAKDQKYISHPAFQSISSNSPADIQKREKIFEKCIDREYTIAKNERKIDKIDKELGQLNVMERTRKAEIGREGRRDTGGALTSAFNLDSRYVNDPKIKEYKKRIEKLQAERVKAVDKLNAQKQPGAFEKIFTDSGINIQHIDPREMRELEASIKLDTAPVVEKMVDIREEEVVKKELVETQSQKIQELESKIPEFNSTSDPNLDDMFDNFLSADEPSQNTTSNSPSHP